jgi:multidrug efflux system outer membrane protein
MKRNLKYKILNILLVLAAISACTMEPKYIRPKAEVPFKEQNKNKAKIATISWEEFFKSHDLQRVIKLALDNNRDLRVANLNIESVQANYGIVRSNLFPTISATASQTKQGVPSAFASFLPRKQFRANVTLASYEVDFFGRLRSLKKSALEDFLASEQARNVTKIALISETANAYAQLLLDRQLLKIAEENLEAQNKKYKFSELRYKNGIDSQTNLLNAEALLETSKTNRETYAKLVEQDENALMLLMGSFDKKNLPKDNALSNIEIAENLLNFIPSEDLLYRPDIKQAEHNLKSANANIGAARAAFFPSITLTGSYGYGSNNLSNLFSSKTWSFTPQINLPIFTGGRNSANLDMANIKKKIEIAEYEKAIQTAFRETLDQLAQRESVSNQLKSYDKILEARKKSYDISINRHLEGINSSPNVLDDEISLLSAQQNQALIKKEYIANLITLYKVLGGGSETEEVTNID